MDTTAVSSYTRENEHNSTKDKYTEASHARSANSRTIFSNAVLTCQFLKGYAGKYQGNLQGSSVVSSYKNERSYGKGTEDDEAIGGKWYGSSICGYEIRYTGRMAKNPGC